MWESDLTDADEDHLERDALAQRLANQRPNPYTRLEAAAVVMHRLAAVRQLVADREGTPPDGLALGSVVHQLSLQLDSCLRGDLDAVEDVRDHLAPLLVWRDTIEGLLWPPGRLRALPPPLNSATCSHGAPIGLCREGC